tara:strand:+ start:1570 stop:2004 length:435 start_codon:yes stop_codon:yes gene_type:complete
MKMIKMKYKLLGKYIKKNNFAISNSKVFFDLAKNISKYKINFDIQSKQIKDSVIEIDTTLSLKAVGNDFDEIETEIVYSAIAELSGDMNDKKELEKIILVKIPKEIYPEIRNLFISMFSACGFKDIKIDKTVDFQKLHQKSKIN